jgi:thymidylate synthase (FAD)
MTLLNTFKRKPQEARDVLPNSLKTEIQVTANVREWRHILNLRTSSAAHPQIRQIMVPLAHELASRWPVLFGEWADTEHTPSAK